MKIYRAASAMKPGEVSAIIAEEDGLHIIKLLQKEPSTQLRLEEARGMLEDQLMGPMVEKRKHEWEEELKKNAKIEILLPEVEKEAERWRAEPGSVIRQFSSRQVATQQRSFFPCFPIDSGSGGMLLFKL